MTDIVLAVEQKRAERMIGASDAAAALGLDKYRPPIAVWRELRGEPREERPAFVQEAAAWGNALEPVIRGRYVLDTHSRVAVPNQSITLDDWLRCTPDGFATKVTHTHAVGTIETDPSTAVADLAVWSADASIGLLQVKTGSAWKRDEWADGAVPPAYEVQIRTELAVTGLPWCDIVCLVGGQQLVGPIRIVRDEKLEHAILRDLWGFWQLVQTGQVPPIDSSREWRDYASSAMQPSKVEIEADAETSAILEQWKAIRKQKSALTEREEQIKTSLLMRMSRAGASKISSSLGNVSAYQAGGRTDWQGYAKSLGGADKPPAEYVKPASTWTLRAPRGWGDDE